MIKCKHKHSKHTKHSKHAQQVVAKQILRDVQGKLLPGTAPLSPEGRPKLHHTRLDKLLQSISRVETEKKKNLLDHFVKRAFESDMVLVSLVKKLHPDLQAVGLHQAGPAMTPTEAVNVQNVLRERFNIIKEEK